MANDTPQPAATETKEPGFFSVVASTLKSMFTVGAIGAVIGAVVAGIAGGPAVDAFMTGKGLFSFGGTLAAAIGTGAAAGGIVGGLLGAPAGCYKGVTHIHNYYHDVAIPQVAQAAMSQGVQLGSQLEVQAQAHERESTKYREIIAQRNPQYAQQATQEQTLAEMKPLGRA